MERFILASSWQILNKHTKFRLWCDITLRNPFSQKQIKDCIYLYFKFVKWSNLLINYNTNNITITMFTSVSDNISTNHNLFIFSLFSCLYFWTYCKQHLGLGLHSVWSLSYGANWMLKLKGGVYTFVIIVSLWHYHLFVISFHNFSKICKSEWVFVV
jgi:hypothetical protein